MTIELKDENYHVHYDAAQAQIICAGSFMLSGTEEYAPVLDLLTQAVDEQSECLILDLRELEFLNSSGINTLTKFVIYARKKDNFQVIAYAQENTPWQVRLLKNLQRLLPSIDMRLV
jgi:hypothetical protein